MVNVGNVDRMLRFVVGLALLIAALVPQVGIFDALGGWKYAVAAVGLIMVATAAFRFCPAYTLFGIKT